MNESKRFYYHHEVGSGSLAEGLEQLKAVLSPPMLEFLDGLKKSALIEIRDFQSSLYLRAGFVTAPEIYGYSDGFLAEIIDQDGGKSFVLAQKVRQNPYQVAPAALNGLDLRPLIVSAIKVRNDTIEILNPDLEVEIYTGEYGRVEVLLPHLIGVLGREIGREIFTDLA